MEIPSEAKLLAMFAGVYTSWKWADGRYHVGSDLSTVRRMGPKIIEAYRYCKTPGFSVVDLWNTTVSTVKKNKIALIRAETGQSYTFAQVDQLSNQVAQWAVSVKSFAPETCVALYMENDPMYIVTWLGLAKAGIQVAMINSNVKQRALVHSVKISGAVGIISGTGVCAENVATMQTEFRQEGISVFAFCRLDETEQALQGSLQDVPGSIDLMRTVATFPTTPVNKKRRAHLLHAGHTFGFIYTSGTTGLPKACKISQIKLLTYSSAMPAFNVNPDDILYGSGMPLYHTAANLAVMAMVRYGNTLVIRRKFSASNHWRDCKKYNVTCMQYIGELCRYLLAAPATEEAKDHRIRIAVGNGLRPEIWNEFQRRHNIPEIGEFYGATEGNAFTYNYCTNYQGQGAIGKQGPLLQLLRPTHVLKFDVENEEPIRDAKTGYCLEVSDGTAGELVSPIKEIPTAQGSTADFEGYTSKEATEKKILRDVFVKGDSYFRTGDLVRRKDGYTYFVDRIGDTFRWKGENVSTMEVSEVLSTFPGIVEASVYGVEVPGKDGRACMVAVRLHDGQSIDQQKFADYCRTQLPDYSVPLFIRFLTGMDTTGTFKHMKMEYKKHGFNPQTCPDKLWYYDTSKKVYRDMTPEAYATLTSGNAKL
eukprot:TRINITY_DN465_c0_g2_i1.p2 TRINITY_DN465_c0_g2~~TRINITY_DN465_c0_g2_i1.p2  ORF type:complete len:648 (+),score=318.42 TRINITY_DN465_c0_g2_i1:234-2177(+)